MGGKIEYLGDQQEEVEEGGRGVVARLHQACVHPPTLSLKNCIGARKGGGGLHSLIVFGNW